MSRPRRPSGTCRSRFRQSPAGGDGPVVRHFVDPDVLEFEPKPELYTRSQHRLSSPSFDYEPRPLESYHRKPR